MPTPRTSGPSPPANIGGDNTAATTGVAQWPPSVPATGHAAPSQPVEAARQGALVQQPRTSTVRRPQVASATMTNSGSNTGQSDGRSGSSDEAADPDDASTPPIPIIAERFKTKMCKNFETTGQCQYGARCMFAHGARELRTTEQNMADGITNQGSVYALRRRMAKQAKAADDGATVEQPAVPAPMPNAPSSLPPSRLLQPPPPAVPHPYALPPWPAVAPPHPLSAAGMLPGVVHGGSVASLAPVPPPATSALWPAVPVPMAPLPPPPSSAPPFPVIPTAPWW